MNNNRYIITKMIYYINIYHVFEKNISFIKKDILQISSNNWMILLICKYKLKRKDKIFSFETSFE